MRWSDIPRNPPARTLRQFAIAWFVVFLAWALAQGALRGHRQAALVLGISAVIGGVAGVLKPAMMRWVFVAALTITFPVGWLVSQLMLLLLFYGIFTPVAWWFRRRGRDALALQPAPGKDSFWAP